MNELEKIDVNDGINIFESIKHIDEDGNEYWSARELQKVLEYSKWEKFHNVIEKAKRACIIGNCILEDHFLQVGKIVKTGDSKREIIDYHLSRHACYLIAQCGDNRKRVISLAQNYFAIQTRMKELLDEEYNSLTEDEKRILNRQKVRSYNSSLNKTAAASGVRNFKKFTNAGYRGLYNGETANDIFKRKGLRYREEILDNMCSEELADNIFRIAQTEAKLKRDKVDNEDTANTVHYEVGKRVRETIKELGGTMPEDLPTPERSIKEIEIRIRKEIK